MADEQDGLDLPFSNNLTLAEQIERYLSGAATDEQVASLNKSLAAAAEHRTLFVKMANLSGLIAEHFASTRAHSDVESALKSVSVRQATTQAHVSEVTNPKIESSSRLSEIKLPTPQPLAASSSDLQPSALGPQPRASSPVLGFLGRTSSALSRPVLWSILAAGIVFTGYIGVITWGMLDRKTPNGTDGVDSFVATITDSSDAKWSSDPSSPLSPRGQWAGGEGAAIAPGVPLQIDSGLVELKLKRGATLLVQGPVSWTIVGDNRVSLKQGKLTASVPQNAKGFTVTTPTATVVDLGTEFGVETDSRGSTEVHIFQGKVELRPELAHGSAPQPANPSLWLPAPLAELKEVARKIAWS